MNSMEFSLVDDAYEAKMTGFEIDCNEGKGEPSACHHVGEFLSVIKNDHNKSGRIYKDNCLQRKYTPSCFNLGKLYRMLLMFYMGGGNVFIHEYL